MFIGHYGVALGAKRLAPRTSLGTLVFATELLDEIWPLLLLAGVEHARIVPGLMAASALSFDSYPITHSLLAVVGWGLVVGVAYFVMRRDRRAAPVVGATVVSHWVLDAVMHRPDLPLWPGSSIVIGAGAWRSIPLTVVLEFGTLCAGLALYLRGTRALDRVGRWGLWAMVVVLVAIQLSLTFGPPPANEHALATSTLAIWLFVPWGWWVDRHRAPVVAVTSGAAS